MQAALITFERQQVIKAFIDNFLGNGFLPLYLNSDSLLGQNPRLIIGRMAEEVAFTLRLKACPRD